MKRERENSSANDRRVRPKRSSDVNRTLDALRIVQQHAYVGDWASNKQRAEAFLKLSNVARDLRQPQNRQLRSDLATLVQQRTMYAKVVTSLMSHVFYLRRTQPRPEPISKLCCAALRTAWYNSLADPNLIHTYSLALHQVFDPV